MPGARAMCAVATGAALFLLVAAGPAAAQDGKALFTQDCAGCHTIGGGVKVGPDLAGIGKRATPAWIERFVADPEKMFASDPQAKALLAKYTVRMPNLGLSAAQVSALVAYLTGGAAPAPTTPTTTTAPTPAPTPAPAPVTGDAGRGKDLFTGSARFANGGPPCLSCHSIAGIGALGGGALGPDLTGALAKYGGVNGMRGVLSTLPFPTMTPVFRGHMLTPAEQADLLAFLQQASTSRRPGSAVGLLLGIGFGGVALAAVLVFLVWPRRALNVRRRLIAQSRGRS